MQEIRVHFVNIGSPDRPATGVQNWRIASRLLGCCCMTIGLFQLMHHHLGSKKKSSGSPEVEQVRQDVTVLHFSGAIESKNGWFGNSGSGVTKSYDTSRLRIS